MQQSWPKNDIAKYFGKVLRGWEILSHPRTSKNTSGLDLDYPVVPQVVLDFAAKLLTATSQHLLTPAATPFLDRVVAIWPTIWIWMQTLHMHTTQCRFPASSNEEHYTAVFQTLRCFTGRGLPRNLVAVVERTDGIARMKAALWIEEAMDTTSGLGFGASELLCPLSQAPDINVEVLEHIVSDAKDASQGLASLLISRIKRNLKQTPVEESHLANDLFFFGSLVAGNMSDPASRTLREGIISHPMVVTMTVDILALILDVKSNMDPNTYKPLLILTLRSIATLCYAIQAHKFVKQILGTTFFTLVADIVSEFPSQNQAMDKKVLAVFGILFDEAIPRFAFHRSFLVAMRRNITTARKTHQILGSHLNGVRTHTESVLSILNEYKRSDMVLLSCGEPQVRPRKFGISHHI